MVSRTVDPVTNGAFNNRPLDLRPRPFDALLTGEPGRPLVLLLHGFAESLHKWRSELAALAAVGYRAVTPNEPKPAPCGAPIKPH